MICSNKRCIFDCKLDTLALSNSSKEFNGRNMSHAVILRTPVIKLFECSLYIM